MRMQTIPYRGFRKMMTHLKPKVGNNSCQEPVAEVATLDTWDCTKDKGRAVFGSVGQRVTILGCNI